MDINLNNYEAFFLDYHEGNLSPEQVAELLLFVEQHPALKEEFESFENISLYDLSTIAFEGKNTLKKGISEENCEEYFIRAAEGSLSKTEEELLDHFLEQHPHYSEQLELFRKTILFADHSIVYENKAGLKREAIPTSTDELLIAAAEGLLSPEEYKFLQKQLSVDAELKHEFSLYSRAKLEADTSVVYENKAELKRKRKTVPVFWYVSGVAAAILLLIGLFFLFRPASKPAEPQFAKKNQDATPAMNNVLVPENNSVALNDAAVNQDVKAGSQEKNQSSVTDRRLPIQDEKKEPSVNLAANNAPGSNPANNQQPAPGNTPVDAPIIAGNQQPTNNISQSPAIAINESKDAANPSADDYLNLREFAAKKIKEGTLDENSVAQQKKNGRLKRISGWDVAQIVTRGISKLTGRDLEVKPRYNEDGEVTAYALGNAFEVTRGK